MQEILQHVSLLREWMNAHGIDAFVIPTADPHGSEYLPDYWKCREWLTGFTGSAGTAIVTQEHAALWTDSRYFIQAAEQLAGTPFELMREGLPETHNYKTWLQSLSDEHIKKVGGVGELIDSVLYNELDFSSNSNENSVLKSDNEAHEENSAYEIVLTNDPFEEIWTDRPSLPQGKIYPQSPAYYSQDTKTKIHRLLNEISEDTCYFVNDLSDIAWLLNLRGSDVDYNPVFLAYLFVHHKGVTLCVDEHKLTPEAADLLKVSDIRIQPYQAVWDVFEELPALGITHVQMASSVPAAIPLFLCDKGINHSVGDSYITHMKAVKDANELKGFRLAMERDGVALVRFRCWLDKVLQSGEKLTEQAIDERLTSLRAEQEGFESLSFATIAASGEHGAIVHYEADSAASTLMPSHGFLLLDSGAQYDCGTTDITRTIPLGTLTDEERRVYTLVLKAHIGLARLRFPEGTNGLQVDTAARAPLWQAGYDYGHGTGHGVGSHLCVHEGPHQIRKDKRPCTAVLLRENMVVTDEPGVYLEGKFGVRLENVLRVRRAADGFLEFEPLTLCPFDTRPVVRELLTYEEVECLNAYHAYVCEKLYPLLSDEADKAWLKDSTKPI